MKAIEENITLKKLFIRSLENELQDAGRQNKTAEGPGKKLQNQGSASNLSPTDSGFEGYSGPDWNHSIRVNESDED